MTIGKLPPTTLPKTLPKTTALQPTAPLVTTKAASTTTTEATKTSQTPALQKAQASAATSTVTQVRTLKMPAFDPKQPAEAQLMVAGTGIGGGPLARLAEQGFQVKFFEAGPPQRDWFMDVPLLGPGSSADLRPFGDGYSPPMALAAYFVEHYETQQKNVDLKLHEELGGVLYPRGQGPGGSGNNNANVAVMPDKGTLDALFVHSGKDPRFSPDNLQKMFARAQDPGPLFAFLETMGHVLTASHKLGIKDFARLTDEKGWQHITRADPKLLLQDPQLLKIVLHMVKFTSNPKNVNIGDVLMRFATLFDSNNALNNGREGFTLMPISVRADGRRSSVADRLKSVLQARPDTMTMECETKVHSLILNDKGTRVEGMRVMKPAKEVLAQRQVIYALQQQVPTIEPGRVADHNAAIAVEIAKLRELEQTHPPELEVKKASNGYVLSAGAFEDPMILIRSGIGPKKVLDGLGIAPAGGKYNEAVGANLKDRREITMMYRAKDKFALLDGLGIGKNPHSDKAMQVWEKSGRGAYASNGVVGSFQFKSDPTQKDADIFAFFVPTPFVGYNPGYSVDAERYPQTFTAILLDKHGNLVSDDSRLMTPKEQEELRTKLGHVAPDPNDPTHMKPAVNFNYERPKPGETPPLYAAMLKMESMFKGLDILTEVVPGNPFKDIPTTSMKATLQALTSSTLFPTDYPSDDIRSAMDWFKTMDVALFDKSGAQHALTVERDGEKARLLVDGKPATEQALSAFTFFGGQKMSPENLVAQLRREHLMEYQHSQQWGHHANGTASMGPDPQNNVIGSDFRVHGLENLWVVSAASTPAAVNPGPFIQLYIAAAIGESASDAIGEQLKANEKHLATMSPIATRMPLDLSKQNTFGENLLVAIERSRGHVGDAQNKLTGEALAQILALHKEQGFSKDDIALAEAVADKAAVRGDQNASVLKVLADEVRKMKKDAGWTLGVADLVKGTVHDAVFGKTAHLSNKDVLAVVDDVQRRDLRQREGAT